MICLTRHRSHEVALGDLPADIVQHFRVVTDVVELGVVLNVSDVDRTAAWLSIVGRGSDILVASSNLRVDCENSGKIADGDVVPVNDIDAEV